MMIPIVALVGIINILAKSNNYNIYAPRNPNFDIRVRREIRDDNYRPYNNEVKVQNSLTQNVEQKLDLKTYFKHIANARKKNNRLRRSYQYNNGYNYSGYNSGYTTTNRPSSGYVPYGQNTYNSNIYNPGNQGYNQEFGNYNSNNMTNNQGYPNNGYNSGYTVTSRPSSVYVPYGQNTYNSGNQGYKNTGYNQGFRNYSSNNMTNNQGYPYNGYNRGDTATNRPSSDYVPYGQNNYNSNIYNSGNQGYKNPGYNQVFGNYSSNNMTNNQGYPYNGYNANNNQNYNGFYKQNNTDGYYPNNGYQNNTNGYFNSFNGSFNNQYTNNSAGFYSPFNATNYNGYNVTAINGTVINNATVTTTPKIQTACVICNIGCPAFFRRFGFQCVPKTEDDEIDEDY